MVSIKDIAKKAGVSISTVSYALNGSPKVTEETSAKILAIAKELNYIPNASARNLKKRETKVIGVYLTDFSGAFYGQLLQGILESLSRNDYGLIVCSGEHSHRYLPERMIDGAIVLDSTFSSDELLTYAERGHKIVILDRQIEHPNINQVLLDNKAGATLAIDHIVEKGHTKLYVVTGPEDSFDSMQRLHAVRQAAKRYPHIEYTEIAGDFTKEAGERAAEQIMNEYDQIAAAFCLNDEMAIGMYNYLANTEYRAGEHIHIIGFDNLEVSHYTKPRLSTIDYSKRKWGALASEQLLKLIKGVPVENERIYVTLIEGESISEKKA
ncbi:LacI family transcriptional regulator [Bacillus sp. CMF21]|nr:LacI family transcriptional regulator [Bacillus sp. CMF21]